MNLEDFLIEYSPAILISLIVFIKTTMLCFEIVGEFIFLITVLQIKAIFWIFILFRFFKNYKRRGKEDD